MSSDMEQMLDTKIKLMEQMNKNGDTFITLANKLNLSKTVLSDLLNGRKSVRVINKYSTAVRKLCRMYRLNVKDVRNLIRFGGSLPSISILTPVIKTPIGINRFKLGYRTQLDFAKTVGLVGSTYSAIESGKFPYVLRSDNHNVVAIASALNMMPSEVVKYSIMHNPKAELIEDEEPTISEYDLLSKSDIESDLHSVPDDTTYRLDEINNELIKSMECLIDSDSTSDDTIDKSDNGELVMASDMSTNSESQFDIILAQLYGHMTYKDFIATVDVIRELELGHEPHYIDLYRVLYGVVSFDGYVQLQAVLQVKLQTILQTR